jgi:hypothetical protein
MKQLFVLVVFLLSLQGVWGQEYRPMVVEGAHWLCEEYHPMIPPGPSFDFFIEGDTVINSVAYKKIYQRYFLYDEENLVTIYPYETLVKFVFGALREDTLAKKVYARFFGLDLSYRTNVFNFECPTDEEFLLYDFDVEAGDTLSGLCVFLGGEPVLVEEVIETSNSILYKAEFLWSSFFGPADFEQEVGFVNTGIFGGGYMTLKKHCIAPDCNYIVSTQELTPAFKFSLFPNPAVTHVQLQLPDKRVFDVEIEVWNSLGENVHTQMIPPGATQVELSTNDWPPGIYWLALKEGGRRIGMEKLVVQR